MTTIINTPPNTESVGDSSWAVSMIILLVVLGIGIFFWLNYRNVPNVPTIVETPSTTDTPANTQVNVTLPSTNTGVTD